MPCIEEDEVSAAQSTTIFHGIPDCENVNADNISESSDVDYNEPGNLMLSTIKFKSVLSIEELACKF